MQVTALYDYEPEQTDELGFHEGDVLQVLHVQDDGWWCGYNVELPTIVGLFPSNYVQAQRIAAPARSINAHIDTIATPRPPASSRQQIQQQQRQMSDTPEFDGEEADRVPELQDEFRGHKNTVLQLRRYLEEAEQASEAARDARRQAEREKLSHSKSWRERGQHEIESERAYGQQAICQHATTSQDNEDSEDSEDHEDDDESAYPQSQGYMHLNDHREVEEAEPTRGSADDEKNNIQIIANQEEASGVIDATDAAASLIARAYRRHADIVQSKQEQARTIKEEKLSEIAAVCIQRWAAHVYSRQRKRRQREREQKAACRQLKRTNKAAAYIQKWIRLRWACFWRRRVQLEREEHATREALQLRAQQMNADRVETDEKEKQRREAEQKETHHQELKCQQIQRRPEEQEHDQFQQIVVDDQDAQRRQVQQVVKGEVPRHFHGVKEQEENDIGPTALCHGVQTSSPEKPRRKVMKKEAVELIKTLVQQQLGETLRDHDTKMDELQRMVARLQTVVRKQTVMLEDSTNQLVNLQVEQQEQRVPKPPRAYGTESTTFLPRIGGVSSIPRQPVAPSGLRAPRPVMLSKLPVLASGERATRASSFNQSRKRSEFLS
ncbi:unnamed protein product [Phytophthora lilii]|uniref:Unnamed protein product n=1 Tax=Phytophthora lilii TaxID=2077276 RepID=A0A9W6WQ20_9STRA|nr:unnamed protein product [Phytophthora lilii]